MAQEVGKVLNRDPERLQFFKIAPYNRDGPGQPVKSTETKIIEEIIYLPTNNRDNRRQRKKMYYQVKKLSIFYVKNLSIFFLSKICNIFFVKNL